MNDELKFASAELQRLTEEILSHNKRQRIFDIRRETFSFNLKALDNLQREGKYENEKRIEKLKSESTQVLKDLEQYAKDTRRRPEAIKEYRRITLNLKEIDGMISDTVMIMIILMSPFQL